MIIAEKVKFKKLQFLMEIFFFSNDVAEPVFTSYFYSFYFILTSLQFIFKIKELQHFCLYLKVNSQIIITLYLLVNTKISM